MHRGLILPQRPDGPLRGQTSLHWCCWWEGAASKQAWTSVAYKGTIYPFPALYLLPQMHAPLQRASCLMAFELQSYRLKYLRHSSKINSWTYNRGCYKVPSQCPLGKMLCGESNVIIRPSARPHFPLISVFTCGLLVPRQTGYWAFDFEIGLVLQ